MRKRIPRNWKTSWWQDKHYNCLHLNTNIFQMKTKLPAIIFLFTFLFLDINPVKAQETSLMIRVQSRDAKFIGTSIGGAKVIVKDENSGEILAEGITTGSTGDTDIIMKRPKIRGERITNDSTAGFLAKLNIDQPVFVTVEALAPVNKKQARVRSSTQLWIIPGEDITGEGLVLEVPGLVVDILSPQTHETIDAEKEVQITANVVLMCGCPVTEGGIWDANKYEVMASISKDGKYLQKLPLKITKKPSTFTGNLKLSSGNYEIIVYAIDPAEGNTGLDKTNIIIK